MLLAAGVLEVVQVAGAGPLGGSTRLLWEMGHPALDTGMLGAAVGPCWLVGGWWRYWQQLWHVWVMVVLRWLHNRLICWGQCQCDWLESDDVDKHLPVFFNKQFYNTIVEGVQVCCYLA